MELPLLDSTGVWLVASLASIRKLKYRVSHLIHDAFDEYDRTYNASIGNHLICCMKLEVRSLVSKYRVTGDAILKLKSSQAEAHVQNGPELKN